MTEFRSVLDVPHIPDDLSIPQFILDSQHPSRPLRPHATPWLIEDHTGRPLGHSEVIYLLDVSASAQLHISSFRNGPLALRTR